MLTSDLVRVNARGGQVRPSFVDPAKPAIRERAEALVACFADAVERSATRREIDQEIEDILGDGRDAKFVRGLAKVCYDRSSFETESVLEPAELRWKVFTLARERGPLALDDNPFDRPVAGDILAQVASELDVTADAVREGLYADLAEAQRVQHSRIPDADWLLDRYNVALVQAVLLKATEVQLSLHKPSAPRVRQLMRSVKFHQLLHRASKKKGTLSLVLDGPSSLFHQSTRYGMQLANFFPAVLLQDCRWTLEARVLWGKSRRETTLRLSNEAGLRSHYQDKGAYETREQQWFRERWRAAEPDWKLSVGDKPINLAGKAVVMPDFTFKKGGRTAHMEIVGFWRRDYLQRRAELLAEHGPGNLVLAVSRKLRGEKGADLSGFPGEIIEFAEIVPVKQVLTTIERIAV